MWTAFGGIIFGCLLIHAWWFETYTDSPLARSWRRMSAALSPTRSAQAVLRPCVGLVQECGGLTEQLFECVSAAFGKNAFNVCIREGLTRCVQQAVTLQVLIMRISKTRQRKRQQIHDTDDKGKQTSSPEQEAEECGSSDLL